MTEDDLIRRLRNLKAKLSTAGQVRRLFVPIVEAFEVSLTHGIREVGRRARLRLGRPTRDPHADLVHRNALVPLADLRFPVNDARLVTSIVIAARGDGTGVHRCLSSIFMQTPAMAYEVIVVTTESALTESMSRIAGVHVIEDRSPSGAEFLSLCNRGARAARGEFILFLDGSIEVLPGWLDALHRSFERHDSIGAVGAKLIASDGQLQHAGGIVWADGDFWEYGKGGSPETPEHSYVRDVDFHSGACLAVRRSLFELVGGFDSTYGSTQYGAADFAFRLRERGHHVLFQPSATVAQLGDREPLSDSRDIERQTHPPLERQRFVARHAEALALQHPHDHNLLDRARNRMRGRRVLVIDRVVPHHDQDAGSVRMRALLQMLVELGHQVTFLPDDLSPVEPYTSELQQLGIEVLFAPMSKMGFVETHADQFDIAILCRARFAAKYLPTLQAAQRRPFIIFDSVDLHYLREERLASIENDRGLANSAARTRGVEFDVMRSSDMVWVTSTHEADLLRRNTGLPGVEIVPPAYSVRANVPPFGTRRNILFIGGFLHDPNEDAVLYFVNDILPFVRRSLPGVQFVIVGSHTPPRILRLASEDVRVLGHVVDVDPVFDACRVSVAPLRYGAGVKGKVIQSLACGLPTVVTPIAAEGLELVSGEHLLVAADADEFARHVVTVYQDEALWTRLSHNGARHVERSLSYESIKKSVGGIMGRARHRA